MNDPAFIDDAHEHHYKTSRARVCDWSMRDVLGYLAEHYVTAETYEHCESSADMATIDRRNRLAAARYMAGLPVPMTPYQDRQ